MSLKASSQAVQYLDHAQFAFAGYWDSAVLPNGEVPDACTILTATHQGVASHVHDRIPVILPQSARDR